MLKEQRKRAIVDRIERDKQVFIADLAEQFDVSEMTIRRDLDELDHNGVIHRIHGGALAVPKIGTKNEPPVFERSNEQTEEKKHIAKTVAGMIQNGEKIFLGSGTTTLAVAENLTHHKDLTVLTNAITIVNCLIPIKHITLIVFGGFLRRAELSMVGHFTQSALKDIQVDKVVIGMRGIHIEQGLTCDHLQELQTDQAILQLSKNIIIAADHTKFGHVATIRTAPITTASTIVTDGKAPDDMIRRIRSLGIEVIKATPS